MMFEKFGFTAKLVDNGWFVLHSRKKDILLGDKITCIVVNGKNMNLLYYDEKTIIGLLNKDCEIIVERSVSVTVELKQPEDDEYEDEYEKGISDEIEKSFSFSKPKKNEELFDLVKTDEWPDATEPSRIVDPDDNDQQYFRAKIIIDRNIGQNIERKKVLDFGCGNGFVTNQMALYGADAYGFDFETWTVTDHGCSFSSNWEEIIDKGPYDYILVYDVFDHMNKYTDVSEWLKKINKVLKDDGQLSVVFHPWCCRHGGHMLNTLNKAFAHLVFDEQDLLDMDCDPVKMNPIHKPIMKANMAFKKSGFKIIYKNHMKTPIEPFFLDDGLVKEKILENWGASDHKRFIGSMSLDFMEFKLLKK